MWVEVWKPGMLQLYPREKLLLGVLYRSPSDFQGRKQKEQWELIRNNINTAMEKHHEEGPVLVVRDWNLKTLQDKAPNSFDSFLDDISLLAHPDNQITLLGARKRSGANDFGVCSVDDVVAAVEVGKMGISSDHLPVLTHILSDAKDDDEESRTIWNCIGDGVL